MKKICRNCVFWEKGNTYSVSKNDYYGKCLCGKFVYDEPKQDETDNLVYSDYEGYSAGFDTGKNFGCIHFKEKP